LGDATLDFFDDACQAMARAWDPETCAEEICPSSKISMAPDVVEDILNQ